MKLALLVAIVAGVVSSVQALGRIPDDRERTWEEEDVIFGDADDNRRCHTQNDGYLPVLQPGKYADSAFHNCFRTDTQIYEYIDALAVQNPTILTKFGVAQTVQNRTIWGYKLSTGNRPKSLYFQAQLHAREWIAGASAVFTLSSFLDDIATNKPTPAADFNLYFVPIVNRDGYQLTWGTLRYQRKNANQVDLNRNWPSKYPNPNPPSQSSEVYPGPFPFSEPETNGIDKWIASKKDEIDGYVDIHSYAGLILYAFGDTKLPIGGGVDEKFAALGNAMSAKMVPVGSYIQQPSWKLYLSYGVFPDYIFRTYNKPAITIEVVGNDFVAPVNTIRTRGKEIYNGLVEYAKQVVIFNGGTTTAVPPTTTTPTTTKPSVTPAPTTTKPSVTPTTTKPQC
ncbi:hypothetical protein DYB37_006722 [Aphanomyces astaci]|uniref:Peptidase M14 domain-containing protein n=1 Tax=Aphanomyces astaci TaxID=112090 RepID=A0A3R6YA71_APHAT|nr:hypothetical protein DYB35_010535 [Aphanomyces astaci]RHZ06716.1 hypothetical protein DYB37_006722 [Aphanomyces astaci]